MVQQKQSDTDVVVVSGHVERGKSVLALYVRVSFLLQQKSGHLDLAVLGCDMQGSEPFLEN